MRISPRFSADTWISCSECSVAMDLMFLIQHDPTPSADSKARPWQTLSNLTGARAVTNQNESQMQIALRLAVRIRKKISIIQTNLWAQDIVPVGELGLYLNLSLLIDFPNLVSLVSYMLSTLDVTYFVSKIKEHKGTIFSGSGRSQFVHLQLYAALLQCATVNIHRTHFSLCSALKKAWLGQWVPATDLRFFWLWLWNRYGKCYLEQNGLRERERESERGRREVKEWLDSISPEITHIYSYK